MADAFFQALCCQPVTVFGRKLRPFSLSHAFILESLRNRWMESGDKARSQLLHAVWVCGNDHATNVKQVTRPPIGRMALFAAWSKRYDSEHEEAKFLQYVSDYMEIPEHWEGKEYSGKVFRAPWQYHFALTVAHECGKTVDEAWDMPVALARCYYDVWAEKQGDDSLVSVREKRRAEQEGLKL